MDSWHNLDLKEKSLRADKSKLMIVKVVKHRWILGEKGFKKFCEGCPELISSQVLDLGRVAVDCGVDFCIKKDTL